MVVVSKNADSIFYKKSDNDEGHALWDVGTDENNLKNLLGNLDYKSYFFCSTPEEAKIITPEADNTINSDMVFNILFAHKNTKFRTSWKMK